MKPHAIVNELIKTIPDEEKELVSDGYHTFKELYDHRIALFIALCNCLKYSTEAKPWKSKKHHDGTMFEGGWFIAGLGKGERDQISYHLPIVYWDKMDVRELSLAPKWDGHTPADVVKRLLEI